MKKKSITTQEFDRLFGEGKDIIEFLDLKNKKSKKLNKVYYLICTDNLVESLNKIGCGIDIDRILDNRSIIDNKYIYISTKFGWSAAWDWSWRSLENVSNFNNKYKFFDGKCVFEEGDYIFQGYDNLNDEQVQEVENIRDSIKIMNDTFNDVKKYNL